MTKLLPSPKDLYLYREGTLFFSYLTIGAHIVTEHGQEGVRFTVWAPHAAEVRVAGDFNGWTTKDHRMKQAGDPGVWSLFIPGVSEGERYKYEIHTADGRVLLKADPYAFYAEKRPDTASRVYNLYGYEWGDSDYIKRKKKEAPYQQPLLVYEVHLGTWKRNGTGEDSAYSYRELADKLVPYAARMGYTHLELMPLAEHPFDRSWGYQVTGYYAVTSRFGTPHDFMYFVDKCHQYGVGVIMDWVPGHFCKDDHGLRQFDGEPLYECGNPLMAEKPEWGTLAFDFGKPEVVSFLISNALFWMDMFHIDGLRVDAVAHMLYLNFGKPESMRMTNSLGGEENLEAIAFLRKLNQAVFHYFPEALMMAEDSTDWPGVTKPVHEGGLGFNYKWNMGWMNDMLAYMKLDPIHRRYHHNLITFSLMYAFNENYILPLSHDEVVHGKRSLLHKMPGDYWQKFANLRLFYGYMMAHPGKKLLFMGGEFGQYDEWKDMSGLDWFLLDYESHRSMHRYVKELNAFYSGEPAFWEQDHKSGGFQWIHADDRTKSVVSFIRKGSRKQDEIIVVCNFTPEIYQNYRIGIPQPGRYREVWNSDAPSYGGSGKANHHQMKTDPIPWNGFPYSLSLLVPPLSAVYLKRTERKRTAGQRGEEI